MTDRFKTLALRAAFAAAALVAPAGAYAAEGMPQLDFSNPLMLSQVIWLLIIFGVFYFLCANYLLPPVAKVLEDRAARINADLEAARAAKAQADAALAEHRAATAKSHAEGQAAVAAALAAAQAESAAKTEALNAKLAAQIEAAEQRIAAARAAAMGALRDVAADTTTAIVTRLTGSADQAAVNAAVDGALAARKA
ncbi:F0F1 ATP synthase subunit B' [Acetobacteraceae bacterium H6797]|nr:F0F1 ATP synthase subunit B' [Acetobacteraceae bacterium H6797]